MSGRGYAIYRAKLAEGEPVMLTSDAVAEELRQESEEIEKRRTPLYEWSLRVPEPKSGTLDFKRFPFQLELYKESASDKDLCVVKATQVGVSAFLVRWTMYWADTKGLTALYVFPTRDHVYDFCLVGSERVLLADGTLKPIRDVRVGERVLSSDGISVLPDTVTAKVHPGERATIVVNLEGGRRLHLTPEHHVLSDRGWREAGELTEGDKVCVPRYLPEPEHPMAVSADDAFLMALWLAEGGKAAAGFNFTCGNPEVRARARAIAAGRGWDFYEGDRLYVGLTMKYDRSDDSPSGFLRRYGLRGMTTETISVPDAIMRGPRAIAEEFFKTYLATDGWIGWAGDGTRREASVSSASERLVRDLQVLGARIGIAGTVRSFQPHAYAPGRARKAGKRSWAFCVAEADSRHRIVEMGVPGKIAAERGVSPERAALDAYLAAGGSDPKIVGALDGSGDEPSVGWARVRSIEDAGVEDTYDLTTEKHHAFFTEGALTHNSDARTKPLIENSEYLRSRVIPGDVMNKGLKRIGLGLVYFRGSETKRALDSVDADILALDEYDTLVQANVADAERRISGSQVGLIRRVGVPSISDFGISKEYARSDQRRWMVKCQGCGEHQPITFKDNVALDDKARTPAVEHEFNEIEEEQYIIACAACRKKLNVARGEWVASFPDRPMRGYHMPRLIVPDTDLRKIVKASKEREPYKLQVHFNKDLAEPWEGEGGRLSKKEIRAAQRDFGMVETVRTDNVVTLGCDVASVRALNVRISEHLSDGKKKALWIGTVDSFDELDVLMRNYGVNMAGIDHLPEHRLARGFAERFPGRVYLVGYASGQKDVLTVDDQDRAMVRRVEIIDTVIQQIRAQRNLLPHDVPEDYMDHLTAVARVIEKDDEDKVTVRYVSTGPDDYLHAECYDTVAYELWTVRQVEEEASREVFTPLDEMMEFQRSDVNDPESDTYSAGFPDDYR